MITMTMDTKEFYRDLTNILQYSEGFVEGAKAGKTVFLRGLGADLAELIKNYIDSNARVNPEMLHHVYEWHQVGQPGARLFDINYVVTGGGLSFSGTLSQSSSIKNGSNVPFYNKASIMENGIPVTIKPKKGTVLRFEQNGQEYYVRGGVNVQNPGGDLVKNGLKQVFDSFFNNPMTQSFLASSGIQKYLETPFLFKSNIAKGKRGGKAAGYETGFKWISTASGGVL
jgi:hypothetical protein